MASQWHFDWRVFYDIFRDLGQEPVSWLKFRPCPFQADNDQRHKVDCPVCAGRGEFQDGAAVTCVAPIVDGQVFSKAVKAYGQYVEGDAVMAVSPIIPSGDAWVANPLFGVRLYDRVVTRHMENGRATTSLLQSWKIADIAGDSGTVLTRVQGTNEDTAELIEYVVGTEVTLDLATCRLVFAPGVYYPKHTQVVLDFQKPSRYVVFGVVPLPTASGEFAGGQGPKVFHLKQADVYERIKRPM
ncbi:MAG: hypothetical protein WC551_10070 [Patescibacteria group bacterium]